ncbi:MAG TPA: TonB family protein [Vicinamibacterales bacterium]|nr:TonB family protein [Vicinamibacterales bacterium]
MYFDFEDLRPDTPVLPRAFTRLEVALLTLVVYLMITILVIVWPHLPFVKAMEAQRRQALEAQRVAALQQQNREFVFVAPRVDIQTRKPKALASLSDKNRMARTVERAPHPTNPLPFARGNTSERVEARPSPRPTPQPEEPPSQPPRAAPQPTPLTLPENPIATLPRTDPSTSHGPSSNVLQDAIKNVQKYTGGETFQNLQGGSDSPAPSIQFDTKGVEFGPWLRRFIAQIRRNWFIPYAAMSLHGHVVLTFYVHKDGSITALQVLRPSNVDAFTNSAFNALKLTNPTMPLPAEYPDNQAFFTVTFYFNENPPQ